MKKTIKLKEGLYGAEECLLKKNLPKTKTNSQKPMHRTIGGTERRTKQLFFFSFLNHMKYMFPRLNDIKILPLHLNTIRIQCRTQFTGCKSLIVFAPPPSPRPLLLAIK